MKEKSLGPHAPINCQFTFINLGMLSCQCTWAKVTVDIFNECALVPRWNMFLIFGQSLTNSITSILS